MCIRYTTSGGKKYGWSMIHRFSTPQDSNTAGGGATVSSRGPCCWILDMMDIYEFRLDMSGYVHWIGLWDNLQETPSSNSGIVPSYRLLKADAE